MKSPCSDVLCAYCVQPGADERDGDVYTSDRLMTILPGLQPPTEVLKICLQVSSIRFLGDPVHPHRRVCTLTVIGALQSRNVDQMRQRVEPSFGFSFRSLHYLAEPVSRNGARLATGSGGLTLGRAGFAPAGR